MDLDKLLNTVCNVAYKMGTEAERKKEEAERNVKKKLGSCSDKQIKRMYLNKDKMKETGQKLIEAEAKRRGIN